MEHLPHGTDKFPSRYVAPYSTFFGREVFTREAFSPKTPMVIYSLESFTGFLLVNNLNRSRIVARLHVSGGACCFIWYTVKGLIRAIDKSDI